MAVFPSILSSSRTKWHRACTGHIQLTDAINAYLAAKPYRFHTSRYYDFSVGIISTLPKSVDALIGEIVYNLRTSLDHAIYAWLKYEHTQLSDTRIQFPFSSSGVDDYEKKVRALSIQDSNLQRFILELCLYPGGANPEISLLNKLSNIDKHRALITSIVSVSVTGIKMRRKLPGQEEEVYEQPVVELSAYSSDDTGKVYTGHGTPPFYSLAPIVKYVPTSIEWQPDTQNSVFTSKVSIPELSPDFQDRDILTVLAHMRYSVSNIISYFEKQETLKRSLGQ